MIDDPHGDRMVGVSIFLSKTITTPCINQLKKWHIVRRNLPARARADQARALTLQATGALAK